MMHTLKDSPRGKCQRSQIVLTSVLYLVDVVLCGQSPDILSAAEVHLDGQPVFPRMH